MRMMMMIACSFTHITFPKLVFCVISVVIIHWLTDWLIDSLTVLLTFLFNVNSMRSAIVLIKLLCMYVCMYCATIVTTFVDGRIQLLPHAHIMDVLYEKNEKIYSTSQKNPPWRLVAIFPKRLEINFSTKFYMPITSSYLHQITNFYSIICNFDEVMPY